MFHTKKNTSFLTRCLTYVTRNTRLLHQLSWNWPKPYHDCDSGFCSSVSIGNQSRKWRVFVLKSIRKLLDFSSFPPRSEVILENMCVVCMLRFTWVVKSDYYFTYWESYLNESLVGVKELGILFYLFWTWDMFWDLSYLSSQ